MHSKEPALVSVTVGKPNRRRLELLYKARRQADHLGPYGMIAKRHQTNGRYRRLGHLRFRFPTDSLAMAFVERLEALHDPRLEWRFMQT